MSNFTERGIGLHKHSNNAVRNPQIVGFRSWAGPIGGVVSLAPTENKMNSLINSLSTELEDSTEEDTTASGIALPPFLDQQTWTMADGENNDAPPRLTKVTKGFVSGIEELLDQKGFDLTVSYDCASTENDHQCGGDRYPISLDRPRTKP